eukprot:COSAG04_NODE_2375_length_4246_cov_1.966241_6_plen_94_part_00
MRQSLDSDEDEPPAADLPELTKEQKQELAAFKDRWVTTKQCKEMGYEDDFTTPQEKQLGRIMHDDHRSDFYIVSRLTTTNTIMIIYTIMNNDV